MKIALITIWHERNYGAEMQAYATIRALKELGHDVEMIDLRLSDITNRSLKGSIASLLAWLSPAERGFRNFWKKYFHCTRRYYSLEELKKDPPKADCFVVGSDQVWNPEIVKSLVPAFFLDFGEKNVRRVAYAASFGKNEWYYSTEFTLQIKKYLTAFNAIACREQTGCDILRKKMGIDSVNVIDPTLLHKEYSELTDTLLEKPTLACYPLSFDPELQDYSQHLATRLNLKWINANEKKHILRGKLLWERNSIERWIETIATAQLVVTRSFHGLAFSLIYHRQFIIVNSSNRSSRITDLLEHLGLADRFFTSFDKVEEARPWEKKINYTEVEQKLQGMRTGSWNFLKENLQ